MGEIRNFWVRIKPYNPGKGYKLRRYVLFGLRFDEGKRWYRVPEVVFHYNEENREDERVNVVDYLRQVRNDNENENSPLAFDICTQEEAHALDEAERKAKEEAAAKAENPHPIDLVKVDRRYSRPAESIEETPKAAPAPAAALAPQKKRGRPPKAKPAPIAAAA